jgi:hypothetical protein
LAVEVDDADVSVGDEELDWLAFVGSSGLPPGLVASTRKTTNGSTKGDKFRSVEIGPRVSRTLQDQLARRAEMARGDQRNAPVFVMPVRIRKVDRGQ